MKKLKTATMMLAAVLALAACQKSDRSAITPKAPIEKDLPQFANYRVCTELTLDGTTPRGATLKNKQWDNGTTIKVSLNGGTTFVKNKVKAFANEWSNYANIKFVFVTNDRTAPIRVSFKSDGSWSYIGTDAKQIPARQATMNFGWFNNNTSDEEFSRTTIHEFGHALGMIHEHQHPLANIPWDKPAVYDYYAETQGWSKADVDNNLFAKYSTSQTNYSAYDRNSIMHYPVEQELTIGDYSVGWNTVLSSTDKTFIASIYPK